MKPPLALTLAAGTTLAARAFPSSALLHATSVATTVSDAAGATGTQGCAPPSSPASEKV